MVLFSDITLLNKILADVVSTDQEIGEKLLGELDTKLGMLRDKWFVDISAYTEVLYDNALKPLRGRALYPIQCKVSAFVQEQLKITMGKTNEEEPGSAAEPQPAAAAAANGGGAAAAAPQRAAPLSRAEKERIIREKEAKMDAAEAATQKIEELTGIQGMILEEDFGFPDEINNCFYDLHYDEAKKLLDIDSVKAGSYITIPSSMKKGECLVVAKLQQKDDTIDIWKLPLIVFNWKEGRLMQELRKNFREHDTTSEFIPLQINQMKMHISNEIRRLRSITEQQ